MIPVTPQHLIRWLSEAQALSVSSFGKSKGTHSKWIISSVHSAEHERNGRMKAPDRGTLDLAYVLAKATGATLVYANVPGGRDNNTYANTDLKTSLRLESNRPLFWLDIHGMHAGWPEDLEFGTRSGETDPLGHFGDWKGLCQSMGFWVIQNQRFQGLGEEGAQTMVDFAWNELGVSAIQLECSFAHLNPQMDGVERLHRLAKLISMLVRCMENTERKYCDRFNV
jgi:hypothetical protein